MNEMVFHVGAETDTCEKWVMLSGIRSDNDKIRTYEYEEHCGCEAKEEAWESS